MYLCRKEAGINVEGNFMIRIIYNDEDTYSLVAAASKVLGKICKANFISFNIKLIFSDLPSSNILELFGKFFFEFCVESGYDRILSLLGSTTKNFLQNLDALHEHLNILYPGLFISLFLFFEIEIFEN